MVKIKNRFGDFYTGRQGQAIFQGFYGKQIRRVVSGKRKNTAPGQREQQRRFRIGLSWYKGLSTVEKEGLKQFINVNGINLTAQQYAIKTALDRGWATKEVFTENAVTEHYRADWDAEGWPYRQTITITNNTSTDLTDFQVKLELTADNVGANFDWSSGGADLRFYDESGTKLPYWVESWDSVNKTATVWVKVGLIPGSASTTVKMYYGNPSATSESNGDAVFEFFDDFEGTSIDTNKWTVSGTGASVQNGELDIKGRGTCVYSNNLFTPPFIAEGRIKIINTGIYQVGFSLTSDPTRVTPRIYFLPTTPNSADYYIDNNGDGTYEVVVDLFQATVGDELKVSLAITTDKSILYYIKNGVEATRTDSYGFTVDLRVILGGYLTGLTSDTEEIAIDYVFVRKYADVEPSAVLGAEEIGIEKSLTHIKVEHILVEHAGMKHVYILDDKGQVIKEYDNLSNISEGQVCTRLDFRNDTGATVREVIIESVSGVLNSIKF